MVALSVQTVLLMLAAYFLGAALACLIRRSLFAPTYAPAERRVDPLPEFVQREDKVATLQRVSPPVPAPQPVAPSSPLPAVASGAQDLKRIHLIDPGVEAGLNKFGVNRYEQIAAWMREDIKKVSQALGLKDRINQENWIEQASVLAKGGETHYSARRARGEVVTATPTPDVETGPAVDSPLPRPMSRAGVAAAVVAPAAVSQAKPAPATPPMVADRAAFADRAATQPTDLAPAVSVRPTPAPRDNLQRIGGITAEIEGKLIALGVSRYLQIAQWSPADVQGLGKELGTGDRIARENWIEQAQILSRGGATRFSREFDGGGAIEQTQPNIAVASPAPRSDLGSLRSVRSPAFQDSPEPGPEAAQRAAAQNRVLRGATSNDLKRIRGIGVLIEKKLNSMGIATYEHIANWTADDIERVSQSLDFKGRIERENWVEQARILSAGGHTEFSRRVDRGEVETSRVRT